MTAFDTTITLPLDATTIPLICDLRARHHLIMRALPKLNTPTPSPRAELGVLFSLVLPGEPGADGTAIKATIRTPKPLTDASNPIPDLTPGQTVKIRVQVSADRQATNADGRTTPRAVTDEHAHQWAGTLLTTHGFTPDIATLTVTQARLVGQSGNIRFAVRTIATTATVTDSNLANQALSNGIGKGKNYGFGMAQLAAA